MGNISPSMLNAIEADLGCFFSIPKTNTTVCEHFNDVIGYFIYSYYQYLHILSQSTIFAVCSKLTSRYNLRLKK